MTGANFGRRTHTAGPFSILLYPNSRPLPFTGSDKRPLHLMIGFVVVQFGNQKGYIDLLRSMQTAVAWYSTPPWRRRIHNGD
jgi:hypothetical protein